MVRVEETAAWRAHKELSVSNKKNNLPTGKIQRINSRLTHLYRDLPKAGNGHGRLHERADARLSLVLIFCPELEIDTADKYVLQHLSCNCGKAPRESGKKCDVWGHNS
jgi:hypothetical protein